MEQIRRSQLAGSKILRRDSTNRSFVLATLVHSVSKARLGLSWTPMLSFANHALNPGVQWNNPRLASSSDDDVDRQVQFDDAGLQ
jgi:hypothetical protein